MSRTEEGLPECQLPLTEYGLAAVVSFVLRRIRQDFCVRRRLSGDDFDYFQNLERQFVAMCIVPNAVGVATREAPEAVALHHSLGTGEVRYRFANVPVFLM